MRRQWLEIKVANGNWYCLEWFTLDSFVVKECFDSIRLLLLLVLPLVQLIRVQVHCYYDEGTITTTKKNGITRAGY